MSSRSSKPSRRPRRKSTGPSSNICPRENRLMTKSDAIAREFSEWAGAGDWRLLFIHRDRVAKVTPEDVNKVAAKYLAKSNRTVGMFIPTKEVARTPVPRNPDIESSGQGLQGGQSRLPRAKSSTPSSENIEKRVKRLTLPAASRSPCSTRRRAAKRSSAACRSISATKNRSRATPPPPTSSAR